MTNGTTTIDYEYNADGIRTKKTVTTASNHTHVFQSTVVEPTCTENGYTLHVCSCGYIYQDTPVAATGHTFTTTVIDSTCTTNGYTLKQCACGYSYQGGSSGHDFTTLVVEPTETLNGFTLHECDCGYSYESDPVASLGAATVANEDSVSDTKVYDYVYNGSSLVYLTITTNTYGEGQTVETLYFGNGTVTYNGTVYYYVTNLQGDVIAILNSSGSAVVEYTYDAWGNILTTSGSMASTLGVANPLTYRGYVYDAETELYYLQSRYYNSDVGRFLNADGLVTTGQGLLGHNMFAYCGNSPIFFSDPTGQCSFYAFFSELVEFIDQIISTIKTWAELNIMGFTDISINSAISCAETLDMYEIDTPEEKAHFFAQCAAETNFGLWLTEIGDDQYFAGKKYGKKYRGAGYIQLTWDFNYIDFAQAMGDPEIYNQGAEYVAAHYAWQAAGWFWSNKNLNYKIANGYTVKDVTITVRGGSGDWERRQMYYDQFIEIFR